MFTVLSYYTAQVVSITTLSLIGIVCLLTYPRRLNSALVAMICLGNIAYILTTMQYQPDDAFRIDLHAYWLPLQVFMNMGAGCLMFLCFSLFQDAKRFPVWMFVAFGIQLTLSTLRPLFVSNDLSQLDVQSIGEVVYFVFGQLPILMQLSFALIGFFWVVKGWGSDLVESRRILRWIVVGSLATVIVLGTLIEFLRMVPSVELQGVINASQTYGSTLAIFILAVGCLKFESIVSRVQQEDDYSEDDALKETHEADLRRFNEIYHGEKAFLQPGLSVAELAARLAIPQYRLRQLINKQLGYRNFSALLNESRIEEACTRFANPDDNQTPILTIALSIGYQSIAPFNRAFRELKSVTPSEYRRRIQQNQPQVPFQRHSEPSKAD